MTSGRNDGLGIAFGQGLAQMVSIKRLVGEQCPKCEAVDQFRYADNFASLAGKKLKAHEIAKCVYERQHLGCQTALRSSDGLILSPPFAPLAFW